MIILTKEPRFDVHFLHLINFGVLNGLSGYEIESFATQIVLPIITDISFSWNMILKILKSLNFINLYIEHYLFLCKQSHISTLYCVIIVILLSQDKVILNYK